MRTTTNIVLAAVFVMGWSTSAPLLAQEGGFYLGGSIGQSKAKDACGSAATTCHDKDSAWKLLGGYQINRNFAAEFGYTDLGKFSGSGVVSGVNVTARFDAKAWELVGVGSMPFGRISPYGKLGLYRGEVKGQAVGTLGSASITASGKDTNTDLTFGLGVKFDLTNNIGIRGEWQRYQKMGGANVGKSDVSVHGVGFTYRF
jgi:OOP family OmpA-OmpF porin